MEQQVLVQHEEVLQWVLNNNMANQNIKLSKKSNEVLKNIEKKETNEKVVETKPTEKTETPKTEVKSTEKKAKVEDNKPASSEAPSASTGVPFGGKGAKGKKTEAVVNATSLPISTKHAVAVCNMIRNMNIDDALAKLELAHKMKIPVPMRGEIPHKKGIMSGRYPVNALGHFIKVIKSLKANALVNELELEKYKIFCKANLASRPYHRFGKGRFKRTHLQVKLIKIEKKIKNKTEGKK